MFVSQSEAFDLMSSWRGNRAGFVLGFEGLLIFTIGLLEINGESNPIILSLPCPPGSQRKAAISFEMSAVESFSFADAKILGDFKPFLEEPPELLLRLEFRAGFSGLLMFFGTNSPHTVHTSV